MTNKAKFKDIYILLVNTLIQSFYYSIYMISHAYLHFHLCNINHIDNKSQIKLAFNISIMQMDKIKNNHERIKTIEFEGLNKISSYRILSHSHKFLNLYKVQYNQIIKVIHFFKSSGFVNTIKYYLIPSNKTQYRIINISINSLIRKVIVLGSNDLKIPKYFLCKYLQPLVGLPKNYKVLNISIEKIHTWYTLKGFNHTNIQFIEFNNLNTLVLKIYEGQIINLQLNCKSPSYINNNYIKNLESRIVNELSIAPGFIANTKIIETGIHKLKEEQLISYCEYKIINYQNKQKVIIIYDIYKKNISYINARYVNLYSKYKLNIYYFMIKNKLINVIYKLYKNSAKDLPLFHNIKDGNNSKIHLVWNISNIYTNQIIKSLGFKHSYIKVSNNQYKNIALYTKISKIDPILNVVISLPNIKLDNNIFAKLIFYFHHKILYTNLIYPINQTCNQHFLKLNNDQYNTKYLSHNIGMKLQYNAFKYIDFSDNIDLMVNCINKNILHIQRQYSNNIPRKETSYSIHSINILKHILQQLLIKLDLIIQSNNCNLKNYIQQSTLFRLKLESYISLSYKKFHIMNFSYLFKQFINMKYYRIINLPKIVFNTKTYNNKLILLLQVYSPINIINDVNIKFNSISFNQNGYKILDFSPHYHYLYNLEYHYFFPSYYSFYVFLNYSNQVKYNLSDQMHNNAYFQISKPFIQHTMNVGSGIQFKIPIRHMPPLRIEYCINNSTGKYFQLRVYSKYQEYNA